LTHVQTFLNGQHTFSAVLRDDLEPYGVGLGLGGGRRCGTNNVLVVASHLENLVVHLGAAEGHQ
jgi:hypothetical protein